MVKDKTISHYCAISNLKHKDLSETDESVFFTDSPGASKAGWPSRDFPDCTVFLSWEGCSGLVVGYNRDFANK